MKHLKTFELYTGNILNYEVGDIVVCSEDRNSLKASPLKLGAKYKVLSIKETMEDKFLRNGVIRVDIEDIETGQIFKGFDSKRFKLELEFDADKYNM